MIKLRVESERNRGFRSEAKKANLKLSRNAKQECCGLSWVSVLKIGRLAEAGTRLDETFPRPDRMRFGTF